MTFCLYCAVTISNKLLEYVDGVTESVYIIVLCTTLIMYYNDILCVIIITILIFNYKCIIYIIIQIYMYYIYIFIM